MPKDIISNNQVNITGTSGQTYDLDALKNTNTRGAKDESLVVQIWYWSPQLPESNEHHNPNPPHVVIGQIWLSKLLDLSDEFDKAMYDSLNV